jgi:dihydroneopterin aldolase
MSAETTLFVTGLEFYAYHGVPAEEREIGHRYRLDLEMKVECRATETDRVEDTVDYGAVAARLVELGTGARWQTVEKVASLMLDDLFARYPAIVSARLRLAKRLPPAPVVAEEAGVEISRSRRP